MLKEAESSIGDSEEKESRREKGEEEGRGGSQE